MANLDQPEFARPRTMRDFDGKTGVVSYGLDSGMHARFYIKPTHMEYLSQMLGSPIFQDRIMINIIAPGNTKTIWDYQANGIRYETKVDPESGEYFTTWELMEVCENGEPTDPAKYPNAWAAFLKKGEQTQTGYPIEEWGAISRSYAESLKMLGVPTVEALAALSDANAANIMGGMKYRELAKATLSERKANEIVSREQERASRADERAEQLEAKVEQLEALLRDTLAQMNEQGAARGAVAAQLAGDPNSPAPRVAAPRQGRVKQSARAQQILDAAKAKPAAAA